MGFIVERLSMGEEVEIGSNHIAFNTKTIMEKGVKRKVRSGIQGAQTATTLLVAASAALISPIAGHLGWITAPLH